MSAAVEVEVAAAAAAAVAVAAVAEVAAEVAAEADVPEQAVCMGCGEELNPAFQTQVFHNHNLENFPYCPDCSCTCCTLVDSDPGWVPWIDPCDGCNRLKCPVCGMGCGCKWADKDAHGRLNLTSYPY